MRSSAAYQRIFGVLLISLMLCEVFAFSYPQRRPNVTATYNHWQQPAPQQKPSQNWNRPNQWSGGGGNFNQSYGGPRTNFTQPTYNVGGNQFPQQPNAGNQWSAAVGNQNLNGLRNNNNTQSPFGGIGNQQGQQQPPQNNWSNAPQLNNPWMRNNQTSAYPQNIPTGLNSPNSFNQTKVNEWGSSGFGQNGWKNPQQYPGGPAFGFPPRNANASLAPFSAGGASGQQQTRTVGTNPYANLFN